MLETISCEDMIVCTNLLYLNLLKMHNFVKKKKKKKRI